jgi:glycine cleavage system H protein
MTVLFVIATIVAFLGIDWLVQRRKERLAGKTALAADQARTNPVRLPAGIFFAPSHTWLNLFPSGKIRLGIDDFISRLLTRPEIVMLKRANDKVKKGEPLILLKEGQHRLTIRSPLEGDILAVNDELPKHPDLLRDRLFSDGWGYIMKPHRAADVKKLLLGNESRAWIQEEFQRLRDLFAGLGRDGALEPVLLQDGGPPIAGALGAMDDVVWEQLDREFLHVQ